MRPQPQLSFLSLIPGDRTPSGISWKVTFSVKSPRNSRAELVPSLLLRRYNVYHNGLPAACLEDSAFLKSSNYTLFTAAFPPVAQPNAWYSASTH